MPKPRLRTLALTVLFSSGLAAWSPQFHEDQTLLAVRLAPRGMAAFLLAHEADLRAGARGQGNDQVPVVEDVEDQFRLVVSLTEEGARPERLVRELGTLAHQVELLTDPSAVRGSSPLRETFESYADQERPKLVLTREPFWAVRAPLDPRPHLLAWARTKYERHQALLGCVDEQSGRLGRPVGALRPAAAGLLQRRERHGQPLDPAVPRGGGHVVGHAGRIAWTPGFGVSWQTTAIGSTAWVPICAWVHSCRPMSWPSFRTGSFTGP
jgi:hypothetical protein